MITKNIRHLPSPRGKVSPAPAAATDEGYAQAASSVRQQTVKRQFEFFFYSSISGLRTILGSVNTSVSSVLWVENSEITAPSGPPTNQ